MSNHCGTIMSIHIYICAYIYIYMCVDVYVWVCVCSWMGGQGDLISGIYEAVPESPENLSLSTLARKPHKELCLQKSAIQD